MEGLLKEGSLHLARVGLLGRYRATRSKALAGHV